MHEEKKKKQLNTYIIFYMLIKFGLISLVFFLFILI